MKFIQLLVLSVLLCVVLVTLAEARKSARRGGNTRARQPSYRTRTNNRKVILKPSVKHTPPKQTAVKDFLKSEREFTNLNKKPPSIKDSGKLSVGLHKTDKKHDIGFESINKQSPKQDHKSNVNNQPIGFEKFNQKPDVKPTNINPIGVEHLTPVKSAPPLHNSYPQGNVGQYPSYPNLQQTPQHVPSAPPLPNQQNIGQYPSYPNHQQTPQHIPSAPLLPNQQNIGQYPSYPNYQQNPQHIPSAPPLPNQQNIGQYPSYPNHQQNPQYVPSAPLLSGSYPKQNFGNQYPFYPYPGQSNFQNKPSIPGTYPNQPNLGNHYPSYTSPSVETQYPGYLYPYIGQQGYQTYPNQHSYNQGQSNFWNPHPMQQNSNPLFNSHYPGSNYNPNYMPLYPSTGFFGTSNNGLSNYGSHYSPYPGYTGMYGNNYRGNSYRPNFPIPIPIPIPIPTSWNSDDYEYKQMHNVLKEILRKIQNNNKNKTSVFVINNSTVTPCNKEEFSYHGGKLNLTITTCTVFNCTAVSMITSFNTSGKVIQNNGMITMCLNPNATVSTNFSGTAHPKVSEISRYWRFLCVNTVHLNQSYIASLNGTKIGQNITHTGFINGTNIAQNISNINSINNTNIGINLNNGQNNSEVIKGMERKNITYVSIENGINTGGQSQSQTFLTSERNSSLPNINSYSNKTTEIPQNTTNNLNSKINHFGNSTLQGALHNSTSAYNFTSHTNSTRKLCEILDCSTTVFCMPTVEVTCTNALNSTCRLNMTSYTLCVRVKMCKSPSTPIDRFVTLNTTTAEYDIASNNLTETYDLRNLTVITYFPPVLPNFGNFSTVNGTNSTCTSTAYSNGTSTTPLQSASRNNCITLPLAANSSVPLQLNSTQISSLNIKEHTNATSTILPNFVI